MKKLSITKASNGYIVKLINQDLGALKEPYCSDVLVFPTFQLMLDCLETFFEDSGDWVSEETVTKALETMDTMEELIK